MQKVENAKVIRNFKINENNIFKLVVECRKDISVQPGQFVNISIPGVYLPRPISISDYDPTTNRITMVYRVVGEGTKLLSELSTKQYIDLMCGLGNGFSIPSDMKKPLVVGGGLGVAPLYFLIKELVEKGYNPKVLLGFKNQDDEFDTRYIKNLTDNMKIAYESKDMLVTHFMKTLTEDDYDYFYACGPKGMLKAVSDISLTDGELSLEERMACGIGICKCCSIETNDGMKTLCNDGPVLKKGTIRW